MNYNSREKRKDSFKNSNSNFMKYFQGIIPRVEEVIQFYYIYRYVRDCIQESVISMLVYIQYY